MDMQRGKGAGWAVASGRWVGVVGAVLACLIMVTPAASGSSASFLITYKAPYKGTLITPYNDIIELMGCGKEVAKPATFSAHTGIGHWTGAAKATTCKGSLGKAVAQSTALVQDAVQVSIPVKVPFGRANTITFNVTWNITAMGNYTLSYSGLCPNPVYNATAGYGYTDCYADAITQVIVGAWLVDLTTGQITNPVSYPGYNLYAYKFVQNYSYCYNATYCPWYNSSFSTASSSFSGSSVVSFNITAVTNSADKYAIATYVGGDIVEELSTYTGTATGYLNMGTLGNGYNLVSVLET
ncbi:MAG: hypothetical protein L3K09_04515 [Thermoplasmata archaeon]|nr:hypothetical protein [Thermoplasmata archaeon]